MKINTTLVAAGLCGLALTACTPVGMAVGTGAVLVRSVVQERTTMDALRDTEIKLSIMNRLMNHSHALFGDVSVGVVEGRVLLTGSVPEREHKVAAARIAWWMERARSSSTRGSQPRARSFELSRVFCGMPSGRVLSKRISPLNPTTEEIVSASSAMVTALPLPRFTGAPSS